MAPFAKGANLIYLLDRADERVLTQNTGDAQSSQWSYFDKVKNQFMWEVINQIGKREQILKNKLSVNQERKKKRKMW